MIKTRTVIILAIITCLTLTSCGAPILPETMQNTTAMPNNVDKDDTMDKGPVKGGTLKLFSTYPDTLNPILTNNTYVQDFSNLIFESLVKLDKKQKPIPVLCDSWEVSSDELIWTFHIRPNVLWQDNMQFTAQDVEFTVQTILNPAVNTVYKKNVQNIAAFSAIGDSFRIILNEPYAFTPELMVFPILPKHYFSGEDIVTTPRNMKPMGTGPYKFVEYTDKKQIRLMANEKWWGAKIDDKNNLEQSDVEKQKDSSIPPYISEIEVKTYASVKDAISAFQTRDVDIAFVGDGQCSKFIGRADLAIKKFPGKSFEFITLNLSKPALGDIAVRQAMACAIDKFRLTQDVLLGEATVADVPVIPDTWLYDTNITKYSTDLSKAKGILLQGGWKEQNGIMYKNINGVAYNLNFEILVNDDNDIRFRAASKISEQLKPIGINITVKKINYEQEFGLIKTKIYDMALVGCNVTNIPDISFLYSSTEIASGRNLAGYSNITVDNYLRQIMIASDSDRRKALFLNMKDIITDELPYIGLYFYSNAVLYNKKIRGDLSPYIWNRYNDITKWYIPLR